MKNVYTTAGALLGVLAFTNPTKTPKIAYDNDLLAETLTKKLLDCIGEKDGSLPVILHFGENESELMQQFHMICFNISDVYERLYFTTQD